jgi:SAM-dependent methyltransferase
MGFAGAYARARNVPGWLTESQAQVLYDVARRSSRVLEVGSHHGRSTIVLAAAGAQVVAVDPFPSDWRYGGDDTEQRFRQNLERAGVADRVDLRVAPSTTVRESWTDLLDVVYVDGKHDYWSASDDLRWADHLAPGGVLLVHDAFSSLGVTLALLRRLLAPRPGLVYQGRVGSLATLVPAAPGVADRVRVLRELPWFARNLVIKVLLRLRIGKVASALGHAGTADPY